MDSINYQRWCPRFQNGITAWLSERRKILMNKKELIETFRGGLAYGRDYETVELLLDKEHTKDNKLCLQAYDANLMGLPSVSEWSTDAKKKLNDEVCRQTKDYNIDVYVDDVLIKQRKD